MSDIWLTPEEVAELTGLERSWKAQARKLAQMGVPFRLNGVGRPLVERSVVLMQPAKRERKAEPNWGAIRRSGAYGKAA